MYGTKMRRLCRLAEHDVAILTRHAWTMRLCCRRDVWRERTGRFRLFYVLLCDHISPDAYAAARMQLHSLLQSELCDVADRRD